MSLRLFNTQQAAKDSHHNEDHHSQPSSNMHTSVRVSPPSCIQHRAARLPRHALLQTQQTPVVPQQQISRSRRATLISIIAAATAASNSASHAADDNSQSTNPSQPITTVFVAGATGQTGSRVVKQLRQRGYNVIAGVRNPAKAAALGFDTDPGITIVPGFDVTGGVESLAAAIGDAQAVVCALGYNGGSDPQGFIDVDSKGTIALIQAAQQRNVRAFVLESSVLTGADKLGPIARMGYAALNFGTNALDRKQEAEAALKEAVDASISTGGRLRSYTIVRPAALSNDPEASVGVPYYRPADTILGGGSVSRDSVAALMVAALEQPGAVNITVEVAAKKGGTPVPEEEWFNFAVAAAR